MAEGSAADLTPPALERSPYERHADPDHAGRSLRMLYSNPFAEVRRAPAFGRIFERRASPGDRVTPKFLKDSP